MAPSATMLMAPDDSRSLSASVTGYPYSTSASRRQRASHSVVSRTQRRREEEGDKQTIPDVYSHRAVVAYTAAHPRRTIPKFGQYLLLQTLGEGEFSKVKLGVHIRWGEEVAVKLIRRDSTAVRAGKVEREIEVLRSLTHSNIVRLYDVIETDKYIGIVIEYASGGELFDYILAHRYLKERDAARLFAQFISGVWYIHQKKIVHRDLKLENLLLDRDRNVIINDFGFANKFEHRADDLMQTSCGSPCYAAPELVISEGRYVGSAVDIWSCGVILYAMLAGYLPFDDDPANPDGENINLLYKYIVNTPLSFPDYISDSAKDLLSLMLVPDPKRRATLPTIMRHPWLAAYASKDIELEGLPSGDGGVAFGKTVEDLERAAIEQHQQRRLVYQKQMRQETQAHSQPQPSPQTAHMSMQIQSSSRSHSQHAANHLTSATEPSILSAEPECLYETSSPVNQSLTSIYPVTPSNQSYPTPIVEDNNIGIAMDDPFAMPGSIPQTTPPKRQREGGDEDGEMKPRREDSANQSTLLSPESPRKRRGEFRHTIQVEYEPQVSPAPKEKSEKATTDKNRPTDTKPEPQEAVQDELPIRSSPEPITTPEERPLQEKGKEPVTPPKQQRIPSIQVEPAPAPPLLQTPPKSTPPPIVNVSPGPSPSGQKKKSRRNTLTVMIEPLGFGKSSKDKAKDITANLTTSAAGKQKEEPPKSPDVRRLTVPEQAQPALPSTPVRNPQSAKALPASTSKANRVMQWFRSKSKGRDSLNVISPSPEIKPPPSVKAVATSPPVSRRVPTTPTTKRTVSSTYEPTTPTVFSRIRNSVAVASPASTRNRTHVSSEKSMRIHRGAVDQTTVTTGKPPVIMAHVKAVLQEMGVEIQLESEFKYRCVRPKRRIDAGTVIPTGDGIGAFNAIGSAASNGVDKRGLPVPSSFHGTGAMLRSFKMRRQSSQVSGGSQPSLGIDDDNTPTPSPGGSGAGAISAEPASLVAVLYGNPPHDVGDEVRFSVELTKIDRLEGTYSLDIRRLKGNLRSYKFLYDTLRERADIQQVQ